MDKGYSVLVHLGKEAIYLRAENDEQAIAQARATIAEAYGERLANMGNVYYEIEDTF